MEVDIQEQTDKLKIKSFDLAKTLGQKQGQVSQLQQEQQVIMSEINKLQTEMDVLDNLLEKPKEVATE